MLWEKPWSQSEHIKRLKLLTQLCFSLNLKSIRDKENILRHASSNRPLKQAGVYVTEDFSSKKVGPTKGGIGGPPGSPIKINPAIMPQVKIQKERQSLKITLIIWCISQLKISTKLNLKNLWSHDNLILLLHLNLFWMGLEGGNSNKMSLQACPR